MTCFLLGMQHLETAGLEEEEEKDMTDQAIMLLLSKKRETGCVFHFTNDWIQYCMIGIPMDTTDGGNIWENWGRGKQN